MGGQHSKSDTKNEVVIGTNQVNNNLHKNLEIFGAVLLVLAVLSVLIILCFIRKHLHRIVRKWIRKEVLTVSGEQPIPMTRGVLSQQPQATQATTTGYV